jgi:CheY-like chemotaxis protein
MTANLAVNARPVEILLVEDNPGDVRLVREALRDAFDTSNLQVVPNGAEAVSHLRRAAGLGDTPLPDLILLDLNLPLMDGREVLAQIKGDQTLRKIPVVVLTSSKADQDIARSYELHANCYINKPFELDKFITVVKAIRDFWVSTVTLPTDSRSTQHEPGATSGPVG